VGGIPLHCCEQRLQPPRQRLGILARGDRLMPDIVGDVCKVDRASQPMRLPQQLGDIWALHEAVTGGSAPELRGDLFKRQSRRGSDPWRWLGVHTQDQKALVQRAVVL